MTNLKGPRHDGLTLEDKQKEQLNKGWSTLF